MKMNMHVFVFSILNICDDKKAKWKSKSFPKRQYSTNLFSKRSEGKGDTLRFRKENCFSTLQKLLIQIIYNSNCIINDQEQWYCLLWMVLPSRRSHFVKLCLTTQIQPFDRRIGLGAWPWLTLRLAAETPKADYSYSNLYIAYVRPSSTKD